jgi:hypothetical protein
MRTRSLRCLGVWALASLIGVACDRGGGPDGDSTPGSAGSGADGADDAGDGGDGVDDAADDGGGDGGDDGGAVPVELDAEHVRFYVTKLAPKLAGRSLTYEEGEMIDAVDGDGEEVIAAIIGGWMAEPGFPESVRFMISDMLHASGTRDGVDFELPGNLAAEIAALDLPWSLILTADYCVAADGTHIECDTGAPYEAGVLSTRAYMISNKGRFNLTRAKRMLETFACRKYPMETDIQIPIEKERLIPMFQAESPDEQTVDEAKGGFGNGEACYTCHSQFGAHAQLFVKYDADGLYQAAATGLQDPAGELGRSVNNLYTSHMIDPAAAMVEDSQVFGTPVVDMRDAGDVITGSPLFQQCTVKNLIGRAFNIASGAATDIDDDIVAEVAQRVTADDPDPTIRAYVLELFTDRVIIDTVLSTMGGE